MDKQTVLIILAIWILALSFITFVLYGIDKSKAKANAYRIPEKVLLLFSVFGGAFGGILAMQLFRHKTKHWYFWVINLIALILHVAISIYLLAFHKF